MCKNGVKKLPLIIRYARDRCKTQEIYDKAVDNDAHAL